VAATKQILGVFGVIDRLDSLDFGFNASCIHVHPGLIIKLGQNTLNFRAIFVSGT
jgi:hypothetical protein